MDSAIVRSYVTQPRRNQTGMNVIPADGLLRRRCDCFSDCPLLSRELHTPLAMAERTLTLAIPQSCPECHRRWVAKLEQTIKGTNMTLR